MRSSLFHFIKTLRALCLGSGLLVMVSCNSTSKDAEVPQKRKGSSDPILQKFASNFDYEKDADGNLRVQSERRSQFEEKSYNVGSKSDPRKDYRVSDFKTENFRTRDFRGVKDFGYENAREQGQEVAGLGGYRGADQRYRGESDDFRTEDFKTGEFRDGGETYRTHENSRIKNNRYIRSEPIDNIVQLENRQESFTFRDVKEMVGQ